jgi:predicted Zn-dependent protease
MFASHVFKAVKGALAALGLALIAASPAAARGLIRDAEIEATLRSYADPLFRAANLNPRDIRVALIEDDTINAYVTNGQNMFIHTGLILAAQNANELKGVLAHETGHISGAHLARSREAMSQAMVPAFVSIGLGLMAIAAGAPDAGAALIAGSQQFAYASFVQHTQTQESRADQAAVSLMEATGQSGRGLLDFANRQFRYNEFLMRNQVPAWMRTHPLWTDRIQALRLKVDQGAHRDAKEDPAHAAAFLMMQAKLTGYLRHPRETLRKYPLTDTSVPARYARAISAMRQADFGVAKKEALALAGEQPNNAYFQELLGEILLTTGQERGSIPHHRKALELEPRHPLLQINLARALVKTNDEASVNEAITLLQQVTQVTEPDNITAWFSLAEAYDQKEEDGMARLATAEMRFRLGDFPGAKSFAERAKERLEKDTPSFRRAVDIATVAETRLRQGRRG